MYINYGEMDFRLENFFVGLMFLDENFYTMFKIRKVNDILIEQLYKACPEEWVIF